MNKSDLVRHVSDQTQVREGDIGVILDIIKDSLQAGDRVMLKDFVTLFLLERKARTALIPKNQQVVDVPVKIVVRFKTSTKLFDWLK